MQTQRRVSYRVDNTGFTFGTSWFPGDSFGLKSAATKQMLYLAHTHKDPNIKFRVTKVVCEYFANKKVITEEYGREYQYSELNKNYIPG